MPYPPVQAWNTDEPTDEQKAKHGAAEFRAVKEYLTRLPVRVFAAHTALTLSATESDAGKGLLHQSATPHTLTVEADSVAAFPVSTVITGINDAGAGVVTIAKAAGVTLVLAGSGAVTSIAVAAAGNFTLCKISTNRWYVAGVGLTGTP